MEEYGGNSHKMKDERKALPDKSSEEKKLKKSLAVLLSPRKRARYRNSLTFSFRKMSEM